MPALPFLIQLPDVSPGKAQDDPNSWVLSSLVGDPDEALGPQVWPGPVLVVAVIYRREPERGRFLCLSNFLANSFK